MKFTIITVTYNCAEILEETIQSVLGQDYPDVEYIIIDGGSTDSTMDIVNRYRDRLAKVVSEPDRGIYDAMNKGIALATGDYINFMNAGDRFASTSILSEVEKALFESEIGILYGNTQTVADEGQTVVTHKPSPLYQMKRHGVFCHQSAFIRADYHKRNPFDISFKSMADYNFFRKAYMSDKVKFQYLDMPISLYNIDEGVSRNIELNYKELHRILDTRHHPMMWVRLVAKKQYVKILRKLGKY